ncbi:kinase-like domain-containing protein [Apodospora peruviana]|uniref:EKC/KEOPS complex subunit BUD32 n=1 Tax=Apodospora peruviana TaxID=516989 RepID=A0AAE0HWJ2_9PEZI|nr:kinase-like domain-containing protein [Apodospora peruviana]
MQFVGPEFRYKCEPLDRYQAGGWHPTHIGDRLGVDGRYRVVNKLGHGGFGVVWLCRDTEDRVTPWKAVKIENAATTNRGAADINDLKIQDVFDALELTPQTALKNQIAIPYEHFWLDGPNGTHLCSVLPILGPSIRDRSLYKDGKRDVKAICRQVIRAMQYLHSVEICHGDFRPANILLQIEGLQLLEDKEIQMVFGLPQVSLVAPKVFGQNCRPRYLVCSADMNLDKLDDFVKIKAGNLRAKDEPMVAVVDFGGASHTSYRSAWTTCIPTHLLAPEYFFGYEASFATDIFALGCTLTILQLDEYPFTRQGENLDDVALSYLSEMEEFLGPMPMLLRKAWDKRAVTRGQKLVIDMDHGNPATVSWKEIDALRRNWVSHVPGARNVLHGLMLDKGMSKQEANRFADLLKKTMAWEATDRLRLGQILNHPWFAEN